MGCLWELHRAERHEAALPGGAHLQADVRQAARRPHRRAPSSWFPDPAQGLDIQFIYCGISGSVMASAGRARSPQVRLQRRRADHPGPRRPNPPTARAACIRVTLYRFWRWSLSTR
jgi:hypothetical protein